MGNRFHTAAGIAHQFSAEQEEAVMMKCLYLLSVVFHMAAGCALSGEYNTEIIQHKGGSVLLPCSCSDLLSKPQKFTWEITRTGRLTEMLNDEHYRGRYQLFNNISPANLSLLISDLREENQGVYKCSTEKEHRDFSLYVKVGRKETSTQSRKTDKTPPSEHPQSKTTTLPPSSSTTQGGRCGENVVAGGHQDCEGKQEDQSFCCVCDTLQTFCIEYTP
ncbi:hypothetical protein C0J45_16125 [Silurus meridionalis]|nr:hypothetical protein C0J45_16125 [Silurus meridionalis]